MEIGDRITELLRYLDISKKQFADTLGISPGNITNWVKQSVKSKPTADVLLQIYEKYNVNLTWLISGNGEMFLNKSNVGINNVPAHARETEHIKELEKKIEDLKKNIRDLQAECNELNNQNKELNVQLRLRLQELVSSKDALIKALS